MRHPAYKEGFLMDFVNTKIHPDYVAAVLIIAIAISEIYQNRDFIDYLVSDFSYDSFEFFLIPVICSIGAVFLLFTKHDNVAKTMTVGALIFALISLDSAYLDLSVIGQYTDYDPNYFATGVINLALGLMLLANIIIYWSRASTNLNIMFYSLAAIFCLNIIRLLRIYRNGASFMDIVQEVIPDLPMYMLIIFIMILLRSDSVKVNTMLYDIRGSFDEIKESAVPTGVRIDRSLIPELKQLVDNGLSSDRYAIPLNSFDKEDYKMVLTRAGDRTAMTLSSLNDASDVGMIRFLIKDIWMDTEDSRTCDIVRIYSDDMFFIQLIAGGPFIDHSEKIPMKDRIKAEFAKIDGVEPVIKADQKDPAESSIQKETE